MSTKEDNISGHRADVHDKAVALLAREKEKREGKQYVRIPIEKGYKEVEKGKYERQMRNNQFKTT